MKRASQILFWLGILSIPLAWLVWYMGPEIEIARQVMGDIADPALRAALQEAHAERLGLWVSVWPTLLRIAQHPRDRGDLEGAVQYARALVELSPSDPGPQQLLQSLQSQQR